MDDTQREAKLANDLRCVAKSPTHRILFVTAEAHPTFRADVRVLFGKYLPRHGLFSDLFALAANERAQEAWPPGKTMLAPATRSKWRKQLVMFKHDLLLLGLARKGYAGVQVRDRILAGVFGLFAAHRAGIPFFYWASYPKPEMRINVATQTDISRRPLRWLISQIRGRLASALLYRGVLRFADHVFVQSDAMKIAFVAKGIASAKITAVPMGVDLEEACQPEAPSSALLAQLKGRRVIVYAGALDKVRQPELMLEALARIRIVQPDVLLMMVGDALDPEDMQSLRACVGRLGLTQHVLFTGWVTPARAMGFMAQAEVGLSTIPRGALYDVSSPTKLAEYFALGLPVVANDLPDQAQVMAESGAGACVPFEPAALAASVLELLRNPDLAHARGRAGRSYVESKRSYAALAHMLADVYHGLLAIE